MTAVKEEVDERPIVNPDEQNESGSHTKSEPNPTEDGVSDEKPVE